MSQPPYAGQAGWVPPPPPPRRKRPRALWFFVAGALILLAPLVFVGALFSVLRPLTQEDAVFAVTDAPVRVDLPAGEERALFSSHGFAADCRATDGSGRELEMRPVTGDFTYGEWTAVARFDTGDGEVSFSCTETSGGGDEVRVAQLHSPGGFVAGIVIGVLAPLLLGTIGLIMLVVVAVLWATGAPREERSQRSSGHDQPAQHDPAG